MADRRPPSADSHLPSVHLETNGWTCGQKDFLVMGWTPYVRLDTMVARGQEPAATTGSSTMNVFPTYFVRFDNGRDTRFVANSDSVALEYAEELMLDDGCEDGEAASVYRFDDGGRGDEEFIGEIVVGSPF